MLYFGVQNTGSMPITSVRPVYDHPFLGRLVVGESGGVPSGGNHEFRLVLPDPTDTPDDCIETTEMTFEIEGTRWRRKGRGEVERL
ncbi:hypothetical protein [Nocardioides sp. L-11A]|uniref:hypothetical protein n=1 Tax=Nocardioides sp. L-11A TaxID=3043848 RepID=UPI00249A386E|nr:hypothetical protein QJ852_06470 [Nocardioides sp. L-11A]